MGTVEGMLEQALALLAKRVGEDPPGSNHNIVTIWWGADEPWCDIAISYEAAFSDNLDAVCGKFDWTVAHAKAFRARGRWRFGLAGIRRGDVVFFDWSGSRRIDNIDHVGLVESVNSDGSVNTLEGNTSDRFLRRIRGRDCVVGYGRPSYVDAAPMLADDGILRRGSTGTQVLSLQRNLNTVMHSGLAVDGDFGPATEAALRAFQAHFGIAMDGEYGPQSAAMMRSALAGGNSIHRPVPRVTGAGPLVVDGDFGPATCAALQRALDGHGAALVVDGSLGPQTARALQRFLAVAVDGRIGPQTIRALQRHVGAAVDGVWGPDTTSHLQSALNADAF